MTAGEKTKSEKKLKKGPVLTGPFIKIHAESENWCPGPESNRYTISGERF